MSKHDDAYWDDRIQAAAERAVGLYKEYLDDKFTLVLEATDFIKEELAKKPDREEFDELKADVSTLKHALKATNKDLRKLTDRVGALETAVYNA